MRQRGRLAASSCVTAAKYSVPTPTPPPTHSPPSVVSESLTLINLYTRRLEPTAEALFLNGSKCDSFRWNSDRLKRRKQLKPSQSEKNANEQNPAIIPCPDVPKDKDGNNKTEVQRITSTFPAGSGQTPRKASLDTRLYNLRVLGVKC